VAVVPKGDDRRAGAAVLERLAHPGRTSADTAAHRRALPVDGVAERYLGLYAEAMAS
jgi:hypothetical protein